MTEKTTKTNKDKKYTEAIGRRKTATARVRLTPASKQMYTINDKDGFVYFPTKELKMILTAPFEKMELSDKYEVSVHVNGGGTHSQAEAVRHGIARALTAIDEGLHVKLKKEGFLKRDPRAKERRKFGLKKARKAPQWSKR